MFFNRVLKIFAIFTGKHLCWSHFLWTLQAWRPAVLLKIKSNKAVFIWILKKKLRTSSLQKTPPGGCFKYWNWGGTAMCQISSQLLQPEAADYGCSLE